MSNIDSEKILSWENLHSTFAWWINLNIGIIVYYSHDFSFLSDGGFYFAELLLFGLFLFGQQDVNYLQRTRSQRLIILFLVLSISTILHFQFEHSFKYFFFGRET